jgi:predicted DNA-binding antitoxin AbrB/MazE fold protein
MSTTVEAVYDDGKLILQRPLPLPEKTRVLVTVETDPERGAWLRVSEEALLRAWDNSDDDVFNELLTK